MEENTPQEGQEVQLSEIELEAMEHGWKPKEDFEADPKNAGKKHRSAEEFMDRQPLFQKIDELSRENKQTKRAIQSLIEHNRKVEEMAYQRVIEQLKAEKKAALEEGDTAKVVEIDDKILDFKATPRPPTPVNDVQERFQEWVSENDWYAKDTEMKATADGIGMSLAKAGMPPEEIFSKVRQQIERIYPEKFGKTRPKALPNAVDSGSRKPVSGKATSDVVSLMSDAEKRIMDTIIRTGMKREDYLRQFVETQPERFKGVKV